MSDQQISMDVGDPVVPGSDDATVGHPDFEPGADEEPGASGGGGGRRWLVAGLAVVVVIVVGVVVGRQPPTVLGVDGEVVPRVPVGPVGEQWSVPIGFEDQVVVVDDLVVVVATRGPESGVPEVRALEPSTGEVMWTFRPDPDVVVAVVGGDRATNTAGSLPSARTREQVAVTSDGTQVWAGEPGERFVGTWRGDHVVVDAVTGSNCRLEDATTGAVVDTFQGRFCSLYDDRLLLNATDGSWQVLGSDGDVVLQGQGRSGPVGRGWYGTSPAGTTVWDRDGNVVWRRDLDADVIMTPSRLDGAMTLFDVAPSGASTGERHDRIGVDESGTLVDLPEWLQRGGWIESEFLSAQQVDGTWLLLYVDAASEQLRLAEAGTWQQAASADVSAATAELLPTVSVQSLSRRGGDAPMAVTSRGVVLPTWDPDGRQVELRDWNLDTVWSIPLSSTVAGSLVVTTSERIVVLDEVSNQRRRLVGHG